VLNTPHSQLLLPKEPEKIIYGENQKESYVSQVSIDKSEHCQIFGLNDISCEFYDSCIKYNKFADFIHLYHYLDNYQSTNDILTEKDISTCKLLHELLNITGFNLKSYFFTGMLLTQVPINDLFPQQLSFHCT
jgi:hypothetical protein